MLISIENWVSDYLKKLRVLKDMKKLDGKLKYTRKDFLHKLSTKMSVKTKQLFERLDKFLEWLRIGNCRELFLLIKVHLTYIIFQLQPWCRFISSRNLDIQSFQNRKLSYNIYHKCINSYQAKTIHKNSKAVDKKQYILLFSNF